MDSQRNAFDEVRAALSFVLIIGTAVTVVVIAPKKSSSFAKSIIIILTLLLLHATVYVLICSAGGFGNNGSDDSVEGMVASGGIESPITCWGGWPCISSCPGCVHRKNLYVCTFLCTGACVLISTTANVMG